MYFDAIIGFNISLNCVLVLYVLLHYEEFCKKLGVELGNKAVTNVSFENVHFEKNVCT